MKFILKTLLILFSLVLMQASAKKPQPFFGEILEETELPDTGEYLYIFSPGGIIDKAFALTPQVATKTCIVFGAGSAALLIILPACKERYYVKNAFFVFHSASLFIPPLLLTGVMISQWEAEAIAANLAKDNDRIVKHLLANKVPFSEAWLRQQMRDNTILKGESLRYWNPWAKPVSECTHCPAWTKMVDMNNVSTIPSP